MSRRCPHCGVQKDYKYYLVNFVSSVSLTYVAFKILDYELHLWEWIKFILSKVT
jgi:heme/copper-type cytochrome/quinol oxidase subunit 4